MEYYNITQELIDKVQSIDGKKYKANHVNMLLKFYREYAENIKKQRRK